MRHSAVAFGCNLEARCVADMAFQRTSQSETVVSPILAMKCLHIDDKKIYPCQDHFFFANTQSLCIISLIERRKSTIKDTTHTMNARRHKHGVRSIERRGA